MLEYLNDLSKNLSDVHRKTLEDSRAIREKFQNHFKESQDRLKKIRAEARQGNFSQASQLYQSHLNEHGQILKNVFNHQLNKSKQAPQQLKKYLDAHQQTYEGLLKKYQIDKKDKFASSSLMWKTLTASLGVMTLADTPAQSTEVMNMHPEAFHYGPSTTQEDNTTLPSNFLSSAELEKLLLQLSNHLKSLEHTPIVDKAYTDFMDLQKILLEDAKNNIQTSVTTKPKKARNPLSSEDAKPFVTSDHLDTLKELKGIFAQTKDGETILGTLKKNKKSATFVTKEEDDLKATIKSLNDVEADVIKTATGSYLKALYPNDDMETALEKEVDQFLQKIKSKIDSVNRGIKGLKPSADIEHQITTNYDALKKETINKAREIILNTIGMDDYYVFYHGYNNELKIYFDILKEFKTFESIKNLDDTNPLRDKSAIDSIHSVDDFLSRFEKEVNLYIADYNKNKAPGTKSMNFLGNDFYGSGIKYDNISFSRNHALSTNINLFGNTDKLAESTLYYFIDSFSISKSNTNLLSHLIKRFSADDITQEDLDKKTERYTHIFEEKLSEAGGNLLQIFVKKTIADDIAYASKVIGVPVLLDKKTGGVALQKNGDPVLDISASEDIPAPQ